MKNMSSVRVIKTACGICPWSCGLNVFVEDGKIVKVAGMKEHPLNKGAICPKSAALPEIVYSSNRLKYPQKKENGAWKRISWNEALETIAEKLKTVKKEYGPQSTGVLMGDPVLLPGSPSVNLISRFCDVYGTPNRFTVASMCTNIHLIGHALTFGRAPGIHPDVQNSNCIILWGHNPQNSYPPFGTRVMNAVKRGAKLIVIDPRKTFFGKKADIYAQIRPGTDAALALGMMNTIIAEDLYDKEYVRKWAVGFDRLAEHVKKYSPEEMEKITWVPAETIREIARVFATNRPGGIAQGINSLDQHAGGFHNQRALSILHVITGNYGVPGGLVLSPMPGETLNTLRMPEMVKSKALGADGYPIFHKIGGAWGHEAQTMLLAENLLTQQPYPINAMIISASNPVVNMPNSPKYREGLQALDFLVVMDTHMTETARLADIVLPAATFLERVDLADYYGLCTNDPYIMLRKKTIQYYECWSDLKFWIELGKKIGFEEYFPWAEPKDVIDYALKPTGITVKQLEEEHPSGMPFGSVKTLEDFEKEGFPTPSGKLEIYSEMLEKSGFDPLPVYVAPAEGPESDSGLFKDYPLIMTTGARYLEYYHSQFRGVSRLRKRVPEPFAEIHPDIASKYGIEDGEMMVIESKRGNIEMKAKVTEDIARQVISIPHGWADANVNVLTDETPCEQVCGYPGVKSMLCRIKKKSDML